MRKFGLAATVALIAVSLGWMASTTARVAPPMSSAGISPLEMMARSSNLPTEHFVDYSLVFTP
jgi:Spy/CpxP family protein refolding chaperone